MQKRNGSSVWTTSLIAILATTPAWARPSSGKAADGVRLREIIVTAQKRRQEIQRVPISIVALRGATLKHQEINSTFDLQLATPGMVFTTNGPFGQPYIRGVGTDILGVGSDSSVAVNIDGVYMARPTAAIQEFYDIDRVEVLRGPQGTLYGRNATGGAINIITNRPQHEFSAGVTVTAGNYNRLRTSAYLNVPIGRTSAFRASVLQAQHDGYTTLFNPSGQPVGNGGSLDGQDVKGERIQFLTRPTRRLRVLLEADNTHENDTQFLADRPDPAFASITPAYILGAVVPKNIRVSTIDRLPRTIVTDSGMHATVTYDMGDSYLKSISAYRTNLYSGIEDIDGTNLNIAWLTTGQASHEFTQELQYGGATRSLHWVAGLYYFREHATSFLNVYLGGAGNPIFGLGLPSPSDNLAVDEVAAGNTTNAYAGYAQASYRILPSVSITLGERYSYEKKDFLSNNVLAGKVLPESASWGSSTPKVGLEYYVSKQVMAYASATRGFKSGGFNDDGIGEKFNPEYLWSYEAGLKGTWLDSRLRTDVDGFYYDYTDLQVRVRDKTGAQEIVANVGQATVYGAEAQIDARLGSHLLTNTSISYLHSRVGQGVTAYDSVSNSNVSVSGNRLPRAPRWTISETGTYFVPLPSGDLSLVAQYRYQSGIYFDIFDRNLAQQAGYAVVNAQVRYTGESGNWYIALWGRNLADKTYRASVIYNGIGGSLDFFGAPRTYGIQAGVKF